MRSTRLTTRLARLAGRSRLARIALVIGSAGAAAACGRVTAMSPAQGAFLASQSGSLRVRDRIGVAEIQATPMMSTLELIRTLRPEYLRPDPTPRSLFGTARAPAVYVDGQKWGGLDALSGVPASLVGEIRRVPTMEARNRYGYEVDGPVIEITLLRRH